METFHILNKSISFDENFLKYISIYNVQCNLCDEYSQKYNSMNQQINTMQELIEYITNLVDFMHNEFITSADNVLNLLAQFQILDKSLIDITSHCKSINDFHKHIQYYNNELNNLLNKVNNMKRENAISAANSVQGNYIGILSTSMWDLLVADLMNDRETRRVEKKQERTYNMAMKYQNMVFDKSLNKHSSELQKEIQEKMYKYGILVIEEMFDYCVDILISENKLSNSIREHLQKEKANTIINNLERIQDENIKQEQIIIALQAYPFSEEVHSKILEYITNNIEEYIRFIRYIKGENIIVKISISKHSNLIKDADNNYIKILRMLGENDTYYKKYINAIENNNLSDTNNSIKKDLVKNIYKFNDIDNISFDKDYKYVFDVFIYASHSIGKIEKQDRINGHIILNRSLSIWQMTPPTTIDIKISKINENKTNVTISTFSKYGAILGSPLVWKNKILKKVNQKI